MLLSISVYALAMEKFKNTPDKVATVMLFLLIGAVFWISSLNGQVADLKSNVRAWEEGAEITNDAINDARECTRCSYDELHDVIDEIRYAEPY